MLEHWMPHSFRVRGHAFVAGEHSQELWGLAEQLDGRQVNRIQRANRFDRERTRCAIEHLVGNGHQFAPACEGSQTTDRATLLLGRHAASQSSAEQRTVRFGQRQRGCDVTAAAPYCATSGSIALEKCRQQCAGFDVE